MRFPLEIAIKLCRPSTDARQSDLTLPEQRFHLSLSEEAIASNILADRLGQLVESGLPSRADDPTHKQKGIYSLTESAIQLVPLLAQMGAWGRRHTLASKELSVRAQILEEGGPRMWNGFMAELRHLHLGTSAPRRSVLAQMQKAYRAAAGQSKTRRN